MLKPNMLKFVIFPVNIANLTLSKGKYVKQVCIMSATLYFSYLKYYVYFFFIFFLCYFILLSQKDFTTSKKKKDFTKIIYNMGYARVY